MGTFGGVGHTCYVRIRPPSSRQDFCRKSVTDRQTDTQTLVSINESFGPHSLRSLGPRPDNYQRKWFKGSYHGQGPFSPHRPMLTTPLQRSYDASGVDLCIKSHLHQSKCLFKHFYQKVWAFQCPKAVKTHN